MAPLLLYKRPHRIIAYIVTVLLDAQGRAWEDFGSTTFKKTGQAGLEPDTCFYIQNSERMRDRQRLDMAVDPPPDLAIESDVTSKTTLDAYLAIAVPEIWIYDNAKLSIYVLQPDGYIKSPNSPTFPELPIVDMIPSLIQQAFAQGTSQMLRQLRRQP